MNMVVLVGRLVADPAVSAFAKDGVDRKVARYRLAVDRGGKAQDADFIPCVVFGKGAEFVEKYLKKGSKVIVSGRIQSSSYTDKEGNKVYSVEVNVDKHEFAETKREGTDAKGFFPVENDEDTPF